MTEPLIPTALRLAVAWLLLGCGLSGWAAPPPRSCFLLGLFGQNPQTLAQEIENLRGLTKGYKPPANGILLIGIGNEAVDFSRLNVDQMGNAADGVLAIARNHPAVGVGVPAGAKYYGFGQGTAQFDPRIRLVIDRCRAAGVPFVPMVQHNLFDLRSAGDAIAVTREIAAHMEKVVAENPDVMTEGWGLSEFGIHGDLRNRDDIEAIVGAVLGLGGSMRFVLCLEACYNANRWIEPTGEPIYDPYAQNPNPKCNWGLDITLYPESGGMASRKELVDYVDSAHLSFTNENCCLVSWRTYGLHDNETDNIEAVFRRWVRYMGHSPELPAARVASPAEKLATVAAPRAASPGAARTWTSLKGGTLTAALVEVKDGRVYLRKTDGGTVTIALDSLSAADRDHIRERQVQPDKAD